MNRKTLPLFVASAIFAGYLATIGDATPPSGVETRILAQKGPRDGKACVNLAPGTVSHIVITSGPDKFKPGITRATAAKDAKYNFSWTAHTVGVVTADRMEIQLTKRAFTDLKGLGTPPGGDLTITLQNSDGSAPPAIDPTTVQYTNDPPPFREDEGEASPRP